MLSNPPEDVEKTAQPLSDQIAEELNRRIISGEISVGAKLRQDAVATEFQVSRTPVREAFRALQGQGIIEILPNRGALVHGPSPRDVRENHQVRAELEGLAAELAARHVDDAHLRELHGAVDRFYALVEESGDPDGAAVLAEGWMEANARFHSVLLDAAHNACLTETITYLRARIPHNTSFSVISRAVRLLRENADDHRAILEAVEAGNGVKARELLKAQVLLGGELVARRYEDDLGGGSRPMLNR